MASDLIFPPYNKLPNDTRHTRLVTILPNSNQDAVLVCTLKEIDIDDADTSYDALSYCCGDESVKVPVIVNGHEKKITTNLNDGLRQFRSDAFPEATTLWIDALSINEDDVEERGYQVQLMGHIYRKADTVHAWLGKGGAFEKRGLDMIERWSQCPCKGRETKVECKKSLMVPQASPLEADDDLHLVSLIFQAPYWDRLWVLQELALAKNVVLRCGAHQSSLQCFISLVHRVLEIAETGPVTQTSNRDGIFRSAWREAVKLSFRLDACPSTSHALHRVLHISHDFADARSFRVPIFAPSARHSYHPAKITGFGGRKASDPRDHVYAWLGMLGDNCGITADYSRTPEQVYMSATVQFIRLFNSVDILQKCGSGAAGLPSWAVDFQSSNWTVKVDTKCCKEMESFIGLSESRLKVRHPRPGVLILQGLIFDCIEWLYPSTAIRWTKSGCQYDVLYNGKEIKRGTWVSGILDDILEGTTSFQTARGYQGVTSHTGIRPGDFICVFHATASRLFCLRPADSNIELAYSLVGSCLLWKSNDVDDNISPLAAIQEVARTKHGGNVAAEGLFHNIALV